MARTKTCPKHVKPAGKKFWREHRERLISIGRLTSENELLFLQLCEFVGIYDEIIKQLEQVTLTSPSGVEKVNPRSSELREYAKRIEHIGNKLKLWGAEATRAKTFQGLGKSDNPNIIPLGDGARKRG